MEKSLDKIVNLCKNRGFVFQGSEIYGGLANAWDYGPLGIALKNNIKNAYMAKFVRENPYNVEMDSAILMNPKVWQVSGHVNKATDPLMDCRACKTRERADHLIENYVAKHKVDFNPAGKSNEELEKFIAEHPINCPTCGKHDWTNIRNFNIMFKTFQGVTEDSTSQLYLRPETAQGIFVNFKNVQRSLRLRVPFGIAQVGKSFRNEITPGNFIFRTREFEQMELEFFCKPGTDLEWFEYWENYMVSFLKALGINEEHLRLRKHEKEELCHYSNATTDIEYKFPFGWGELWGIADRTNYDLTAHQNGSGENMEYTDPVTNEKYIPYVIEPSVGLNRLLLVTLLDAYDEQTLEGGDVRTVLHLHPALAPYTVAVLPLQKNLGEQAKALYTRLSKKYNVSYDETGSIGKRYRRQDEVGTPYCVTIDFQTLEDNTVTIRERDSMEQVRLPIDELENYIDKTLEIKM